MEKSPWFRKKNIGYGWTPNNWKGWLVTLVGILVVVLGVRVLASLLGS